MRKKKTSKTLAPSRARTAPSKKRNTAKGAKRGSRNKSAKKEQRPQGGGWDYISGLVLRDFKGFRGSTRINFKPLTILTGPNSAGKSTITQSLLLLKQTLEASGDVSPLIFDGLVHLGSAKRVVNDATATDGFSIGVLLATAPVADDASKDLELELSDFALEWTFGLEPETCVRQFQISGIDYNEKSHPLVSIREYSEGSAEGPKYQLEVAHPPLAKNINTFLQRMEIPPAEVVSVRFNKFIPESIIIVDEKQSTEDHVFQFQVPFTLASPLFYYTIRNLENAIIQRLHYIGPIRDEPSGVYFAGGRRSRIGSRGEDALAYLRSNANDRISQGLPDGGDSTLLAATNAWLSELHAGEPLSFVELGEDFYEARTGRRRIHEVGHGVGQLLPVIVQCLAATKGSTVVVEQPEIHLHQRLQAGLADFFIAMNTRGVRIIVETHSEILIMRIRRRIAERGDTLGNSIAVHFIADNRIEDIPIDSQGNVWHWPTHFFDQGISEMQALGEAQLRANLEPSVKARPK